MKARRRRDPARPEGSPHNARVTEDSDPPRRRAAAFAGLGVLAVLLATVDDRSYGLIPDGREMLSAGAAVARFLEIGSRATS